VKTLSHRARSAMVVATLLFLIAACAPSGRRPALRDVPLPNVASAAAPVQDQLRQEHAALRRAVADSSLSNDALAAVYGRMGTLFLAAEFFGAAEAAFANAQTLQPADRRWPYYLGHVFRSENDTARAVAAFEQSLQLAPDDVPTMVWLAELRLAGGQAAAAKVHLTKARGLAAREPAVLYGLGRVALETQDYAQAVAYLEDALTLAPGASRVRYPLALAYRGLGDRAKAEAQLRQRGETDLPPTDPLMAELGGLLQNAAAFETRGAQAMADRQWPEAVTSLKKAVELSPANAFNRLNLGTSLYMTGDRAAALESFREAVRLSPDLAKAHFAIGVLMEVEGKDADAIAAFNQAVSADAGYNEARLGLANALRRTGRTVDALPHYEAILRADPGSSQALFGQAIALVRLGRHAEARDRLEAGAKSFPDQPGFAHALARLLAAAPESRLRDGARALSIMEGLLKTQPQTQPMAETTAMALAELGRFDEAIEWQRNAIAAATQGSRADLASKLAVNLRRYQNRQACRVPWTEDDPIHRPAPSSP
jgi:tetratricopeptide (TPR) repeat protein